MKIKLVIYSEDYQYVEHLVNYLNIHYNEMIELNVFNEEEALKEYLDHYKADVVILDDGYFCQLKNNAATVYLTDEPVINEDKLCIFKYQKGEIIYKTILNVYASGTDKGLHKLIENGQEATRIHLFLSINGGAGASTVAKAYRIKLAKERKVLYLNLEIFGDCETVLKADGNFSLDDILYTLKSRRGSLSLKLESVLKKSPDGIYFYAPSANPINLLDLDAEEFLSLLSEIKKSGLFNEIVLDMDSFPSVWMLEGLKEADDIWLIADGTEASAEKYDKFRVFISALEKKKQLRISPKMKIFYNKYSNKTGKPIENCGLEIGGGSPRYEGMEEITIVKKMADSNAFNKDFFKEG